MKHIFARTQYAGDADLRKRVPELAPLASRTAAVIGLGSIGGPIAFDLARAGVGNLLVIDFDLFDVGNSCRWPLGLSAVGMPKSQVVAMWIKNEYPWTQVRQRQHRFGGVVLGDARNRQATDFEVLDDLLKADLVIDATAEWGVQHVISDWCRANRRAFLAVTGTWGGWGGEVVRIIPSRTVGCWHCYMGSTSGNAAAPFKQPETGVQPRGCGDPTFTGAGIDMEANRPGSHPNRDFDPVRRSRPCISVSGRRYFCDLAPSSGWKVSER